MAATTSKKTAPPTETDSQAAKVGLRAAIIAFIALPVLLAAVVAVRTGLFDFSGANLSDTQIKALWAVVAAGLGAAATTIGAFLAYAHNRQSLAFQAVSTRRRELLEEQVQLQKELSDKEADARQRLETAVSGLELISQDGKYAPGAAIAGALATLVRLNQPMLAMRILAAARKEEVVKNVNVIDHDTAAWLISRVFTLSSEGDQAAEVEEAKAEAAALLLRYAPHLTDPSDCGSFSWPNAVVAQWPKGLSRNASVNVQIGLVELMLSQSKDWWNNGATTHTWIIYTLDEALLTEGSEKPAGQVAAAFGRAILKVTDAEYITGIRDRRDRGAVENRMASVSDPGLHFLEKMGRRITKWGAGVAVGAEQAMPPIPTPNPVEPERTYVAVDNVVEAAVGSDMGDGTVVDQSSPA